MPSTNIQKTGDWKQKMKAAKIALQTHGSCWYLEIFVGTWKCLCGDLAIRLVLFILYWCCLFLYCLAMEKVQGGISAAAVALDCNNPGKKLQ